MPPPRLSLGRPAPSRRPSERDGDIDLAIADGRAAAAAAAAAAASRHERGRSGGGGGGGCTAAASPCDGASSAFAARASAERFDWLSSWMSEKGLVSDASDAPAAPPSTGGAPPSLPPPSASPPSRDAHLPPSPHAIRTSVSAPAGLGLREGERHLAPTVRAALERAATAPPGHDDARAPALSPPLRVGPSQATAGTGSGREVLLQGFNWESARCTDVRGPHSIHRVYPKFY